MKLAVFGDIHGNSHALKAAIADALAQGAEGFALLGDFVTDLATPRQTMDCLYALRQCYPCWFVRGNREAYLLSHRAGQMDLGPGSKTGSLYYTYLQMTQADLDFFASLPIYRKAQIGGVTLELAHSLKTTDRRVFEPEEDLTDVFASLETDILFTAHCHTQYIQQRDGKTIVNPGALGIPKGTPGLAPYALADIAPGSCRFRLCAAPYDVEQAIRDQFDRGLYAMSPWWAVGAANVLLTGGEEALNLVTQVNKAGDPADEALWESAAKKLGLVLTKEELLHVWKTSVFYRCTPAENVVE